MATLAASRYSPGTLQLCSHFFISIPPCAAPTSCTVVFHQLLNLASSSMPTLNHSTRHPLSAGTTFIVLISQPHLDSSVLYSVTNARPPFHVLYAMCLLSHSHVFDILLRLAGLGKNRRVPAPGSTWSSSWRITSWDWTCAGLTGVYYVAVFCGTR